MAAGTFETSDTLLGTRVSHKVALSRRGGVLVHAVEALTSLKLTVALFAYGIFVILVGTLAQTEMDIWQVVPLYFRTWVMWLDVNLFFPQSFFPRMPHLAIPPIPLPGGMFVGVLMLANLTAAHLWRFQIQAKGTKLLAGLGVLLFGIFVTAAIIISGNLGNGVQAKPVLSPVAIWVLFLSLMCAGWLGATYFFVRYALHEWSLMQRGSLFAYFHLRMLWLFGVAYFGFTSLVASMLSGALQPPTESMRILWQLLQGVVAGLVLLAGCWMLFGKRAGIVLLHAGVVLMMVNELVVARYAIEWQMTLEEGQAANFVRDIRTTELAITDLSQPQRDSVIVIPRALLQQNAAENQGLLKSGRPIQPIRAAAGTHDLLPFDVTVLQYFRNHELRDLKPKEQPVASAGIGRKAVAEEARTAKGTDNQSGVDIGAVYVKLTERTTNRDLGTYLVSQLGEDGVGIRPERFREEVETGGKKYQLLLRFERAYKPYTVKLHDVRKDDYLGSDTPKNYSSDIQLVDPETKVDSAIHIKMNDPLRYRGDTFYQSSYNRMDGKEITTLAVVSNVGWMIPYIACMIVATGLIFQFGGVTLTRFLNRRSQEEELALSPVKPGPAATLKQHAPGRYVSRPVSGWYARRFDLISIAAALILALGYIGSKLPEPNPPKGKMNLVDFGKLPIVHSGRVKPIDTLARNSLRALSNYETLRYGKEGKALNLSATAWLLDTVTGKEQAFDYRVIKVESPELLKLFDLQPQARNLYSLEQIAPHSRELRQMAIAAHEKQKKSPESVTPLDRKALELDERVRLMDALLSAFNPPRLPPLPSPEEVNQDPAAAKRMIDEFRLRLSELPEEVKALGLPLIIPSNSGSQDGTHWLAYPSAWTAAFVQARILQQEPDAATQKMETLLAAYRENKPADFNRALVAYQAEVTRAAPKDYHESKVRLEAYFNHVSPFYAGSFLYVFALLLALVAWLLQSRPLNLAALTLIGTTFLFHTIALGVRIYISGRPPVTNLYSSAVFIGWACVLFCLVLEAIFRNGLGNVVGAMTGFAALLISYFLSAGGDTIAVLQAVLDTQFWLATHVVMITSGYAATYLAGFLGLCYVIFGFCTPNLTAKLRGELTRMIYGVTCFAVLLSFVGTVLGGLWADDSWGRFWGWDPKENGALIIVLWNALVLHARWDKLVKDRGLALLAIGGNIVTSWSWFGVNELGIGLHSYGFTEGVLLALGLFVLSQIALIAVGLLPTKWWWSYAAERSPNLPSKAALD